MRKQLEKPFEYLRRKDGSAFPSETINRWYEARAYVLDKLKDVAIEPKSEEHLHVVVTSDSPLMLSVVRQVALSAHYANFDEPTGRYRTVTTLVSKNKEIVEVLKKEEYLGNLMDYCKYSLFGAKSVNCDSYLDIEIQIVEEWTEEGNHEIIKMTEEDVKAFLASRNQEENYSIDTRMAVMVNRIYSLGTLIDNLPFEDIHCASRYALALEFFQHGLLREPLSPLFDAQEFKADATQVKKRLSNVFCADCFASRAKGIEQYCAGKGKKSKKAWEENNEALSMSEHARWTTEKLIMGFRPMNDQERIHDERLFGAEKKQYREQLKNDPAHPVHIDILSYADLRRINPDDMKYDSFIMLAIPYILS